MRVFLLIPIFCLLVGCSTYTKILITQEQMNTLGVTFKNEIATGDDEEIYFLSSNNIVRYDPNEDTIERLLIASTTNLLDICITEGVPIVSRSGSLRAVFAGKLIPVLELSGTCQRISAYKDKVYILLSISTGDKELLYYSFTDKLTQRLFSTRDNISEICAVAGGCLVAVGDSVYKVFIPEKDSEFSETNLQSVLLCSVAASRIVSIAADPDYEIVYLADEDMTYAWAAGKVLPLFPQGGKISYCNSALSIYSHKLKQLVQIIRPGKRVEEINALVCNR